MGGRIAAVLIKNYFVLLSISFLIGLSCLLPRTAVFEVRADNEISPKSPILALQTSETDNGLPTPKTPESGQNLAIPSPVPPVLTPEKVKSYVLAQAKLYGVNPVKADWIVKKESQYGLRMRGDDGNSRGYWQISSIYHPEVSTACADDLKCSTAWSLKRIAAGYINEWSTIKKCQKWYSDCPF
jgi:hypothetical protein